MQNCAESSFHCPALERPNLHNAKKSVAMNFLFDHRTKKAHLLYTYWAYIYKYIIMAVKKLEEFEEKPYEHSIYVWVNLGIIIVAVIIIIIRKCTCMYVHVQWLESNWLCVSRSTMISIQKVGDRVHVGLCTLKLSVYVCGYKALLFFIIIK